MTAPYYSDEYVTLYHGDCRDVLATLPDASVDAVVTDPPYELAFMGKGWDSSGIAFDVAMWAEVLRVLKPGGHLLAFGGTRTFHRVTVAIEDAGFEVRDCMSWLYGSGFPKSLDVSKAIDKARDDGLEIRQVTAWIAAARNVRQVVNRDIDAAFGFNGMAGHWTTQGAQAAVPTLDQVPRLLDVLGVDPDDVPDEIRRLLLDLNGRKGQPGENWLKREVVGGSEVPAGHAFAGSTYGGDSRRAVIEITTPATEAAAQWEGWGTALKPAWEPIIVARKPLTGTVAANVLEHGTGALNIDGCRIATDDVLTGSGSPPLRHGGENARPFHDNAVARGVNQNPAGRWPANVVLDEEAAALLDAQSGVMTSTPGTTPAPGRSGGILGAASPRPDAGQPMGYADTGGASRFFYVAKAPTHERPKVDGKAHATVKPLTLIRWLVRLVTPPGGHVLDPFAGSGTTAEACLVEGYTCTLIEKDADHLPLITERLAKPIQPTMFGAS